MMPPSAQEIAHDRIVTFTGSFSPLAPSAADVQLVDIAHALAQLCRFGGHVRAFYSVAQHAVLVSHVCAPPDALWGLLHDASEAYVSDIVRPVKYLSELTGYRDLERRVQWTICEAFGLGRAMPESVRLADDLALWTEQRDLLTMPAGWEPRAALADRIVPMSPFEAEHRFLQRFRELAAPIAFHGCATGGGGR